MIYREWVRYAGANSTLRTTGIIKSTIFSNLGRSPNSSAESFRSYAESFRSSAEPFRSSAESFRSSTELLRRRISKARRRLACVHRLLAKFRLSNKAMKSISLTLRLQSGQILDAECFQSPHEVRGIAAGSRGRLPWSQRRRA
jgi:hypothetical protein